MTPEGAKLQLIFGRRILVEMLLLLLWLLLKSRGFVGVVVAIGVWAGTGGRIVTRGPSLLRFETSYSKQAQRTVYDLSLRHLLLNSSACKLRDSYRVTTVDSERNVPK